MIFDHHDDDPGGTEPPSLLVPSFGACLMFFRGHHRAEADFVCSSAAGTRAFGAMPILVVSGAVPADRRPSRTTYHPLRVFYFGSCCGREFFLSERPAISCRVPPRACASFREAERIVVA
jgi:hypothetical protein